MSAVQSPLIAHLLAGMPGARLIETHISWVILADEFAYKLKKPLNLGFLDFSTLDKRRACCEEEIRLNRRLAPQIYLEVLPVTGDIDRPCLGGDGPVLEWAVKMRAFPGNATLDLENEVTADQVDAIADRVAAFHQSVAAAPEASTHGTPEQVQAPIRQNFLQLRALEPPREILDLLDVLEKRAQTEGERLAPHFAARKPRGFIRECHGDLHLGNIAWVDDAPLIFDGIEFNPDLRYIDVISEMAFLTMDLCHRQREDLAWRVLNRYLEHTGDYPGLAALHYYMGYRALVRAKVAGIRARQEAGNFAECLDYLRLGERLTHPRRPGLILMHGVSGSGKTVLSQTLLQGLGAIRLRSDVERKRLFGLPPLADSRGIPGGIYSPEAGELTRDRLLELAGQLLGEGFRVIVDATFLARNWREPFRALAGNLHTPWCIVSPQVPPDILRQRVAQRRHQGGDASEADLSVLEAQLLNQAPLDPMETHHAVIPTPAWDEGILLARTLSLLTSA